MPRLKNSSPITLLLAARTQTSSSAPTIWGCPSRLTIFDGSVIKLSPKYAFVCLCMYFIPDCSVNEGSIISSRTEWWWLFVTWFGSSMFFHVLFFTFYFEVDLSDAYMCNSEDFTVEAAIVVISMLKVQLAGSPPNVEGIIKVMYILKMNIYL